MSDGWHELAPHRAILRNVGYWLIAIGIIDIGVMIYSIINHMEYDSSANIFSVIAGIFLVRGNLRVARIVTWFLAFGTTALISALILLPTLYPADLLYLELRADPMSAVIGLATIVLVVFLFIWIYRKLRSPAVIDAYLAAHRSGSPPKSAFVLGAMFALSLIVPFALLFRSEPAAKAIELAKAQVGSDYKFQILSMNWTNDRVKVDLKAYNATETKPVHVEWQR